MIKNNSFEEIADILKQKDTCLIFTHIVMDGDAIGSSVALCLALRKLGKKAYLAVEDDMPKNLRFLENDCLINYESIDFVPDVAIALDCSDANRFPKREELFNSASLKICVDHHKTADGKFDYAYIDSEAGATSELVFYLIMALGITIDKTIARCIFAGITTDTGNFQYSNTTKKTHMIVASLYDVCDSFNDVSVALYENESFAKIKLQSEILENAKLFASGKAVISYVTQQMLRDCDAVMDDSEGTVSKLRAIENVEVAVMLREKEAGTIKASLRSKTYVDVSEICKGYGGGGHARAAGFTCEGALEEVSKQIVADIEEIL